MSSTVGAQSPPSPQSPKTHKIHRLTVLIDTDSKALAEKLQDQFSQLCRNKLKALLDSQFSAMSSTDEVIRIDRLEVDLGEFKQYLDEDRVLRELPELVNATLRAAQQSGLVQVHKIDPPMDKHKPLFSVSALTPDTEEPDEFAAVSPFLPWSNSKAQRPKMPGRQWIWPSGQSRKRRRICLRHFPWCVAMLTACAIFC